MSKITLSRNAEDDGDIVSFEINDKQKAAMEMEGKPITEKVGEWVSYCEENCLRTRLILLQRYLMKHPEAEMPAGVASVQVEHAVAQGWIE